MDPQQHIYKATLLADRGDMSGARQALETAISAAEAQADDISRIQASVILAEMLIHAERFHEADRLLSSAKTISRRMSSDAASAVAFEITRARALHVIARWPFEDPRNVAVITTRHVLNAHEPILLVVHNEDDGAWEFYGASPARTEDAMIVALSEIIEHDVSIGELFDLPVGWRAERQAENSPWIRARQVAAV